MSTNMEANTDSTRKLASIQTIRCVEKHIGADALELATILGWQVVTRIGEVTPGTKVIYCEIDSMLPVNAPWLPPAVKDRIKRDDIKDHFRVKTIKLRGELSQGLIIPIVDTLPKPPGDIFNWNDLAEGTNITEVLEIQKYEPQAFSGKFAFLATAGGTRFPTELVDKTDEPRVQSEPKLLTLLQGKSYYSTVKLDGTSVTYVINPTTGELLVCSRNLVRKKPDNPSVCPYWYIAAKYDIEAKLKETPNISIQGEICGPNIQRNLLGLKDLELFVFNLVDIRDRSRLRPQTMKETCRKLGLKTVPFEEEGDSFQCDSIKILLAKAQGPYLGTKNPREGLVMRSEDQTISFKAINNDYLLKYGY